MAEILRICLGVGILAVTGAAAASGDPLPSAGCERKSIETGARIERSIEVAGTERTYILHVPERIDAGEPVALLLDFHGWGHSGAGVWNVSRFKEIAERDGFITAYPDGLPVRLIRDDPRPGWEIGGVENNRDLAFTKALLDEIESGYCIDRTRVYSTGFSNGAFFSNILGCVMSDRIAAIAPVGGGQITIPCRPPRSVSVLIYHGAVDDVVPAEQARRARDQWASIDGCKEREEGTCQEYEGCADGSEVRYCEVDTGHHWPPQATAEIWKFFQRHRLRGP